MPSKRVASGYSEVNYRHFSKAIAYEPQFDGENGSWCV
jgi:hypothetical protein